MTVLRRAEKGIKEEGENVWKRERKTTAGKVMKHMLKNERSLTEREKKKNPWRGGKAIKHILRGKRRWLDGVGLRAHCRAVKYSASASGWDRQLLELACGITKGNGGQPGKWLWATSLLWRKETKSNPQALYIGEKDSWLRKIHTCTHTAFLPRLSQKTQILCESLCLGGTKEKPHTVVIALVPCP